MIASSAGFAAMAEQQCQQAAFLKQVAASFGKASDSYISAARLQQQVARDALAMLPAEANGCLLDVGCGPGWLHPEFSRYCAAFSAVDLSEGMLHKARTQQLATAYIQADAASLPLADRQFDKLFSSLMLQWCPTPKTALAEMARVLAADGRLVISTLIKGTLTELRDAFATLDQQAHIHSFLTADELITAARQLPDISWQFERRSYQLYYPDVQTLARELKALGANQVAGRSQSGLTGKGYWRKLAAAYEQHRCQDGIPATYQVLFIQGTKHGR
ncbi:malonyl-ACP O-methyltransferase BioC [Arsukibacterium sp.]|uniref:malonyl-ACP O-methyltransferase BioC n=1 Tax=Arsukibacterium sp. TaxID=1977258 RepID=UPI00299ED233|nr:malonyl-ACP O-methyltransferase BioC [Arsukibacterium sp.]MDX1678357.1 malonyl-ACP O-methyltransferase BioC [Arsukibacterium sp.]